MSILFMQGVSSQRDLILAAKSSIIESTYHHTNPASVLASHSDLRYEILLNADMSYLEPKASGDKILFLKNLVAKHAITVIHAGSQGWQINEAKTEFDALNVKLITGAVNTADFEVADNKAAFTKLMTHHGLDVVPAIEITNIEALEHYIQNTPFENNQPSLCIKPVRGIYGLGFWRFKSTASLNQHILNPTLNIIHPDAYVEAMQRETTFKPQLLMPFYSGAETSVDMVVDKGEPIFALARVKQGRYQSVEIDNRAIALAKRCAKLLNADGLINIQTINDPEGNPLLLEANLRPSGGVCFSKHCGINIASVFVDYFYFNLSADEIAFKYKPRFLPILVKVDSHGLSFSPSDMDKIISI